MVYTVINFETHGCSRLVGIVNNNGVQQFWIWLVPRARCGPSPHDSTARYLHPGTHDDAQVDHVAQRNVLISVAMRSHFLHRRKTVHERVSQSLGGDEQGLVRGHLSARGHEVVMRVDEPGQDSRLTEINHSSSRGNRDAAVGSDVSDSLTLDEHNLFGYHPAVDAVEHPAGANRHRCRSRRA